MSMPRFSVPKHQADRPTGQADRQAPWPMQAEALISTACP